MVQSLHVCTFIGRVLYTDLAQDHLSIANYWNGKGKNLYIFWYCITLLLHYLHMCGYVGACIGTAALFSLSTMHT